MSSDTTLYSQNVQDAELIMESRGYAPDVRSVSFTQNWSKLYQTPKHSLDMSCRAFEQGLQVQGQVLSRLQDVLEPGQIVLKDSSAGMVWSEIGVLGDFSFELDAPGAYQLEAIFGDTTVRIQELVIS